MLSVLVLLDPVIDIEGQTNADDARPTDHDRSEKRRRAAPARGYQELRRKRPYEALSAPSMTFALSRLREPEEGYTGPSTYEAEEKEKELSSLGKRKNIISSTHLRIASTLWARQIETKESATRPKIPQADAEPNGRQWST